GADRVAVAHHRDDQAEPLLRQLLRGAGTRGMAGMGWRRGRVVRPLLGIGRDELRAYATARDLRWVEDPTNADPRYLRNRVRAELLPLLEALRPGAARALARSAEHAAADADLLDALVAADPEATPGPDGWSRAWLLGAPTPLARRALRRVLPSAASSHLDAVMAAARAGRGEVELPGGARVRVKGDRIVPDGM